MTYYVSPSVEYARIAGTAGDFPLIQVFEQRQRVFAAAAEPIAAREHSPDMPAESPRRRSTVREPAPMFSSGSMSDVQPAPAQPAAADETPAVRVQLSHNGVVEQVITIPAPASSVPTVVDQSSLARSWNVLIPAATIQPSLTASRRSRSVRTPVIGAGVARSPSTVAGLF